MHPSFRKNAAKGFRRGIPDTFDVRPRQSGPHFSARFDVVCIRTGHGWTVDFPAPRRADGTPLRACANLAELAAAAWFLALSDRGFTPYGFVDQLLVASAEVEAYRDTCPTGGVEVEL